MVKFNAFSTLKNIFSRLNPIPFIAFDETENETFNSPTSDELLKKAIREYSDFEKVILIAIYHLINTQNVEKEYLTVLTKDLRLICDLLEGTSYNVKIPKCLLDEPSSNILVTCHNHFKKNIIPSTKDLKNVFKTNVIFTIIVSEEYIGILINGLGENFFEFSNHEMELFKNYWKSFFDYLVFSFAQEKPNEFLKYLSGEYDENDVFQEIYDDFLGENIEKFVNELNIRFKKYNIYLIQIKI